ncbi:MAG: hypothetical protein O2887_17195 [Bacteroidetes bacterium]|nr:hypothetical protein [Bacteroidota bacterium]MDA1122195.1 hypothetical protein [Bacteroidota bacterium]
MSGAFAMVGPFEIRTQPSPGDIIDVTAWRQENSMTVHLVNLTNPMMLKGPFRELIPGQYPKGVSSATARFIS